MKSLLSAIATTIVIFVLGVMPAAQAVADQPDEYSFSEKAQACESINLECFLTVLSPEKKTYNTENRIPATQDLGAAKSRFGN